MNDDLGRAYLERRLSAACRPGATLGTDDIDFVIDDEVVSLTLPLEYQASTWALDLATMTGNEASLGDHYRHWDPAGEGRQRHLGSGPSRYQAWPTHLVGYDDAEGAVYLYRPVYDEATPAYQGRWHRLTTEGAPSGQRAAPLPQRVALWAGRLVAGNEIL